MSLDAAARRYAKAVFDLANEQNALERFTAEIKSVGDVVAQCADLSAALSNPTVAPPVRKAIMSDIVARLGVSPMVRNAVLLITDHNRAALLPRIAAVLGELADVRAGKVRAEVASAAPLTEAQYTRISAALERMTGRKISLARRVDPTLIGGVVTRVGDKVYDGSVRTRLAELRQTLLPS